MERHKMSRTGRDMFTKMFTLSLILRLFETVGFSEYSIIYTRACMSDVRKAFSRSPINKPSLLRIILSSAKMSYVTTVMRR